MEELYKLRSTGERTNLTKSVVHATEILIALAEGVCSIKDISKRTGLNQSTIHRILNTLKETGFATRNELTRQYSIGFLINHLAYNNIHTHRCLITSVYNEMRSLWKYSKETVTLHIQYGMKLILLEQMLSHYNLSFAERKRENILQYAGSIGRTLLSQLGDDELELIIKRIDLLPFTQNTITDKAILIDNILKVRQDGYTISFGEVVEGTAAISIPVKNYICPAAITVVGPGDRFTRNIMELVEIMKSMSIKASANVLEDCQSIKE